MTQTQNKQALCEKHHSLLYLLYRFGNGAMPLLQLRMLALILRLYVSDQAVNRAVRELKAAGILTRRTWVGNRDLILSCKYVYRYFRDGDSQAVATPRRASTLAPYAAQARKVEWLIDAIIRYNLDTLDDVEHYLARSGCTLFLHPAELSVFYERHRPFLAASCPGAYTAELQQLETNTEQRRHMIPAAHTSSLPVVTLENLHRRGIYIAALSHSERLVKFVLFPRRTTRPDRILTLAADAGWWARGLLPDYDIWAVAQCLDSRHTDALRAALTAPVDRDGTPYWRETLRRREMDSRMRVGIHNSNFLLTYCNGIEPADF